MLTNIYVFTYIHTNISCIISFLSSIMYIITSLLNAAVSYHTDIIIVSEMCKNGYVACSHKEQRKKPLA